MNQREHTFNAVRRSSFRLLYISKYISLPISILVVLYSNVKTNITSQQVYIVEPQIRLGLNNGPSMILFGREAVVYGRYIVKIVIDRKNNLHIRRKKTLELNELEQYVFF